jgi:hypothetical protein
MKNIVLIIICTVFVSCTRFLIGEKKLTYNEAMPYLIIQYKSPMFVHGKFYVVPIEKIKEIRGYPWITYEGSENKYSFFRTWEKLGYTDEIIQFALPDSFCINKNPHSIYDKPKEIGGRLAVIVYNKMVIDDTGRIHDYPSERQLTYNGSTPFINPLLSEQYKNEKFYTIPIGKVKECRGYPDFQYLGSENNFSFFKNYGHMDEVQEGEIKEFALPDSLCANQYPNTINDEFKKNNWHRLARIMDNKMVVADY